MTRTIHDDSLYGGVHPALVPTYTIAEAGHLLRLPKATVRAWVRGQPYSGKSGRRMFQRVIRPDDGRGRLLSFRNLVELHVLSAIRRCHRVSLPKVRKAVRYLETRLGVDHPLACRELLTDGRSLLIEQFEKLVNVSEGGQLELKEIVSRFLERVTLEGDTPVRLFPLARIADRSTERPVVIDPRVNFGKPSLAATGVPTRVIVDRWQASESIPSLAADFGVSQEEIEEALRYELPIAA